MFNSPKRTRKRLLSPAEDLEDGEIAEVLEAVKIPEVEPFNDGYDDQFMGDAEDRARLQGMNELERETELYQRSLRREDMQRKWDIRCQLAKEREVAVGAEEDAGMKERSLIRRHILDAQRAGNKRANAFERLMAIRNNKMTKEKWTDPVVDQLEQTVPLKKMTKVKLKATDIYSDDSSSSMSDARSRTIELTPVVSTNSLDQSVVTMREQLCRAILTRIQLESLLDKPVFEKTVVDCFVRVCIGSEGSANASRIYQIIGLQQDNKDYQLGGKRTNIVLRLRYGVQERLSLMDVVSNQPVTQYEFYMWSGTWQRDLKALPLLSQIAKKQEDIANAMEYSYTEGDVEKIIQSKRQAAPKRVSSAYKKVCLIMERDQAMGLNDMEKVKRLEQQIEELDGPSGGQLDSAKEPQSQSQSQPPLARINAHVPPIYSALPVSKRCHADRPPKADDFQLEQYMRRKYKKSSVVSRSRVEVEAEDWGGEQEEEDEEEPMVPDHQPAAAAPVTATPEELMDVKEVMPKVDLRDLHNFKVNLNTSSLGEFLKNCKVNIIKLLFSSSPFQCDL